MDFLRTLPDFLQPLELPIIKDFIPAVTGKFVSDLERDLFTLPACMGRLGLCNPSANVNFEFESSLQVTSALVQEITEQQQTHFSLTVVSAKYQAKATVMSFKTPAACF